MTPQGHRHTMSRNDLIDLLINMRIKEGKTRLELFDYLVKDLGYDEKTGYKYMADAREETDRRAIQNFGEDLKEDIERWEAMKRACTKNGDGKGARECMREIGKLKGHYIERTTISGKIDTEITVIKLNGPEDDLFNFN